MATTRKDRWLHPVSPAEQRALERIRRAGVRAPDSAILAWIRAVGPEVILKGSLADIRAVANAF